MRKLVNGMFVVLVVAWVGLGSGTAYAGIINFDMTSLSPAPIYDTVVLESVITTDMELASGGSIWCSVYDGLDLSGGAINGCAGGSETDRPGDPNIYSNPILTGGIDDAILDGLNDGILDGIFSLDVRVSGFFTSYTPQVYGIVNGIQTDILVGNTVFAEQPPPDQVPTPATIPLVALGWAALGFSRRRKSNS